MCRQAGLPFSVQMHLARDRNPVSVRMEQRRKALQQRQQDQDKKAVAAGNHGVDIKLGLNRKQQFYVPPANAITIGHV